MSRLLLLSLLCFYSANFLAAQYAYEPSEDQIFGLPNPDAPAAIHDFSLLIGECNCKSTSRKPDGEWNEPIDMLWRFKYIMNGMGVQDETLKSDGGHSGSIRQYIEEEDGTGQWYVHYYSSNGPSKRLSTWTGGMTEAGDIVLYREQNAPNGAEGSYRLTFHEIDEAGYKWKGEWVSKDESIVYPTWVIDCKRKE